MKLRFILFLVFSGVTVIPVISLAAWIYVSAIDKEVDNVRQRHLLLAKNLSAALDRYARDVRSVFKHVALIAASNTPMTGTKNILADLEFTHLCVADTKTGKVVNEVVPDKLPCPAIIPKQRLQMFLDLVQPEKVVFSPVMANPLNQPNIYLLKIFGDKIVIGAISTDYIVSQGKAIAFGKRGHAAIVDSTGRVIAHPLPAWRKSMKDISRLKPVQKMLARETGTIEFFSPALKADMVAGYTFVPTTGWGVMIPQPFSELTDDAGQVRLQAIAISIAGVLFAGVLSWFLSGYLTRPLSSVITASRQMSNGNLDARVEIRPGFKPRETEELRSAFNTMAQDVSKAMTARDQAQQDRLQALHSAEQANQAKTEFLANMSHELRSPLNAIIGFSELMKRQILGPLGDPRYQSYAQDISRSGEHLLSIIDDILDVSKIEAGEMTLDETEIDVARTMRDCIAMMENRASDLDVNLTFDSQDHIPALRADDRHVRQIVINLISNAMKFTPAGGEIKVSVKVDDDSSMHVIVADTGIGIAAADLSKVLQAFGQVVDSERSDLGGTGLGLTISKALIELHGGNLSIDSDLDRGTTVTIEFPAERTIQPT